MPPPSTIDATPPPPADVAGQMGPKPSMGGVAASALSQAPGTPNQQGAIIDQWQACKKVLEQMARMSPKLQPFVGRSISIMEAGVAEAAGGAPSQSQSLPKFQGPESVAPPTGDTAASFPG